MAAATSTRSASSPTSASRRACRSTGRTPSPSATSPSWRGCRPPRSSAEPHRRSVTAGIALWVLVVAVALGAPGLYAYKKGLLFFAHGVPHDSAAAILQRDTVAQRLLADTGTAPAVDSVPPTTRSPADTARARLVPPGTPGRLTLQGLPAGARVTLNGAPFRGSQGEVPPNVYKLAVQAEGYAAFERQVIVSPGAPLTVKVDLRPSRDSKFGPCEQYGPAYNQDGICWDARPVPLASTKIPVPADAPIVPRPAILLCHVSRSGETMEVRLFVRSNVDPFNDQALDLAKTLRWNPAQKNGEPVDSWVQVQFVPERQ